MTVVDRFKPSIWFTRGISLTCESFIILVTSGWILLAMPKSINFNDAFTMTKFAGFKSLWTIPAHKTDGKF